MVEKVSMSDALAFADAPSKELAGDVLFLESVRDLDLADKAIQLGFMLVCLCRQGSADFEVRDRHERLEAGGMLVAFGHQVFSDCHFSPDFDGYIALVSTEYSMEVFSGLQDMWPYMLYWFDHPVLPLNKEEFAAAEESFQLVLKRLRRPQRRHVREATTSLLRVLTFDVCDLLASRQSDQVACTPQHYAIFDRFLHLLTQNFRQQREVQWYAEQMHLTPKYLSEVVKRMSGRTAGDWITNFVVAEIKSMLRDRSMSIKEISITMNFQNQSFMGKFFRNVTGISPTDYRNS